MNFRIRDIRDPRLLHCEAEYGNRPSCDWYDEDIKYHRCKYYRYYPAKYCTYRKDLK